MIELIREVLSMSSAGVHSKNRVLTLGANVAKRTDVTAPLRVIIAVDLDCFYAAVVVRERPHLRDKPVAVVQKHLCVTTNYVARAPEHGGVGKMTPVTEALRACPSLVLVDGSDLAPFRAASREVVAVVRAFFARRAKAAAAAAILTAEKGVDKGLGLSEAPCDVLLQRSGLDEVFVDVSRLVAAEMAAVDAPWRFEGHVVGGVPDGREEGADTDADADADADARQWRALMVGSQMAAALRAEMATQTGLTACAGVSNSKLLAKLAVSQRKPDAQTVLLPSHGAAFVSTLAPTALPGVGRATGARLQAWADAHGRQLRTAGDVVGVFGVPGGLVLLRDALRSVADPRRVLALCSGADDAPVVDAGDAPRSLSVEDACRDCNDMKVVRVKLGVLARRLLHLLALDAAAFARRPTALSVGFRFRSDGHKSTWRSSPVLPVITTLSPKATPDSDSDPTATATATVHKAEAALVRKALAVLREHAGICEGSEFQLTLLGLGVPTFSRSTSRPSPFFDGPVRDTTRSIVDRIGPPLRPAKRPQKPVEGNRSDAQPPKAKAGTNTHCPVCAAALPRNNLLMNQHIDRCVGDPTTQLVEKNAKRARTTLQTRRVDSFFSKR